MKRLVYIIFILCLMVLVLSSCCFEHVWKTATCTDPETCSKCGETRGEALGHLFTEATCTEPKKCSRCWETEGKALGHTVTCASNEPCARCGKVVDHYFKGSAETGLIYCTVCDKRISHETFTHKDLSELSYEEKAYISWVINYYMTALDSYGNYKYNINEAYSHAALKLDYSFSFIKDFWENGYGMNAYNTIYNYKR